ncbi:heptahelical transmembrane protein 2-like [Olea europaea var. sylvestris]|uniref:heptahelical transmembrane protein 2-like n=1 Tax=Olea europaea var. sylvestris TaxID=158386 RepID=UPI000C1D2DC5|nr:heptahelical transmembrane protein 2-like [Olea europaea var. sylvestris]
MKKRSTRSDSRPPANGDRLKLDKKKGKFEKKLLKYEDLPEYLKDNEFIRDYYRCEWPLKHIVLSLFSLHNETLNVWTHLLGFIIFVGLTVMSLTEKKTLENVMASFVGEGMNMKTMNQSNSSDSLFSKSYVGHIPKPSILHANADSNSLPTWPWFVFLGGAMNCLIFSSISHLFACHSQRFYLFFWRLDYAGISLMIICSFFAPIYYTFSNHPHWRLAYLSSITLVGILAIITLLAPALSSGRFRGFRAALFLSMGFSGVIPAAHALILHWDHPQILVALGYEIAMGLLYAVGAVFYVTKIPERWKPGTFDIVGHSHQIFHILVVAAALTHCAATLVIMEWHRNLRA